MSLITHRCSCGHPEWFHSRETIGDGECMLGWCRHGGRHEKLESYLLVAYSSSITATAAVETPIVEPGSKVMLHGRGPTQTCGCPECQALYRQLAGVT